MTSPGSAPSGILLDLDGTVYLGDAPLPGAVDAVNRLQSLRVPVRFITNATRMPRRMLAERLRTMGFVLRDDELFTAPIAAADWLRREGIRRVMLCLPAASAEEFGDCELTDRSPEAVVVGDLGEEWNFERMNRAFRAIQDGALLIGLQKNRYWMTGDGISLDAGPFVVALEYATRTEAVMVGKPSRDFFSLAASSLGMAMERIAMVGDDIEADVGGAQAVGMRGALVRTGKFRQTDLERAGVSPDEIGDDVGDLVRRWYG